MKIRYFKIIQCSVSKKKQGGTDVRACNDLSQPESPVSDAKHSNPQAGTNKGHPARALVAGYQIHAALDY
jgi:hypothetical protein